MNPDPLNPDPLNPGPFSPESSVPPPLALFDAPSVAAALPHLMGFHPRRSVVCLWLRAGTLIVTQRADLPDEDVDDETIGSFVDAFLASAAHVNAEEAIVALVGGDQRSVRELAAGFTVRLGLRCRCVLEIRGSRVRERRDGPGPWQWIDSRSRQRSRQEALRGLGCERPALDRSSIEAECRPDPASAAATVTEEQLQASLECLARTIEAWGRDRCARAAFGIDEASLLPAVTTSSGRDLVMWWAAGLDIESSRALLEMLLRCTRATRAGFGSHVAAAACAVAWLCGDGVRANVALDRCLSDDPSNRMGRMLERTIGSGVPPENVRDMLASVDWETVSAPVAGCR